MDEGRLVPSGDFAAKNVLLRKRGERRLAVGGFLADVPEDMLRILRRRGPWKKVRDESQTVAVPQVKRALQTVNTCGHTQTPVRTQTSNRRTALHISTPQLAAQRQHNRSTKRFSGVTRLEADRPLKWHNVQLVHPRDDVKLGPEDGLVYPEGGALREERCLPVLCTGGYGRVRIDDECVTRASGTQRANEIAAAERKGETRRRQIAK